MKGIIMIIIAMLALMILIAFLYFENSVLSISNYVISFQGLPKNFDGYKIVHLSDLHNKSFGKRQKRLIDTIKKAEPDMIAITGDLVDRRHYREDISMELIREAVKIAPIYYVTGNHEWWSGKYEELQKKLQEQGVVILDDKSTIVHSRNEWVYIIGVDDAAKTIREYRGKKEREILKETLEIAIKDTQKERFRILLSHRPEKMDLYEKAEVDLVLSGHVHGGQWRVPGVGGLLAPGQGLFPEYDGGLYRKGKTTMVVSRGLGNSIIPIRLFNRPEVVVITLKSE
jgi:predicted MPP superfamily phosphohydrolase